MARKRKNHRKKRPPRASGSPARREAEAPAESAASARTGGSARTGASARSGGSARTGASSGSRPSVRAGRPGAAGATGREASGFAFRPTNYALFAGAVAAILAGYVLLSRGSVTAAPLFLVLGYVVLIPAALLVGIAEKAEPASGEDVSP